MGQKSEYRSAKRSKKLIKTAFAQLLHEKDVSKITVTDIIERAGVSRGTFYAHFTDVNGLFNRIIDEEFEELTQYMLELGVVKIVREPEIFFTAVMDYLNQDMEYYRSLLLAKNNLLFLDEFKYRLSLALSGDKPENEDEEEPLEIELPEDVKVYISFFITAVSTVMIEWLNGEIVMTQEEFIKLLGSIIRNTFKPYFEQG